MKRVFALFVALMMVCGAAMAEATVMTVEGRGIVTVAADAANIVLGVQEYSEDVLQAQATANAKIEAICAALVEAGVPEDAISTQNLYIYGTYDYSTTPSLLTGYTVTNTLNVYVTEMDKVGGYIDIAFSAGAATLDYIEFLANNSNEARDEALILAVSAAREKAATLAEAMGMQIARVVAVHEGGDGYSISGAKYGNVRSEDAAAGTATEIRSPELQVSACVTIEFELIEGET